MSLKGVFKDSPRILRILNTYVIEISNFQWWITLKQNEKSSSESAFCIFPFYLDNGTGKGLYGDVLLCIVKCLTPLRCRNPNITAGDTPHSLTFVEIWAPHSVRCCSLRLHIKLISCSHSISLRFHCGIRISPICTRIIFSSDWLVASPYQPRVLSAIPRLHWLSLLWERRHPAPQAALTLSHHYICSTRFCLRVSISCPVYKIHTCCHSHCTY